MAIAEEAVHPTTADFRPGSAGIAARVATALAILAAILVLPLLTDVVWHDRISRAAIFAVIGLSVNVITGHAGQLSLGHQAFVGIGAFMSAFVASSLGAEPFAPAMPTANFLIALTVSAAIGALMALFLGMVALRIRGLYLALITLAFGLMAETTVFNWEPFTGGGAGATAPRPALFISAQAYAYLCLLFVGLFLLVDWRLVKTKAGRAVVALRNDERVAATLGINVTAYKLLAFMVAGTMAAVAGGLFAHRQALVQAEDFDLPTALLWVIMAVVGGLGSRAGVLIASSFFAIFPTLLPATSVRLPFFGDVIVQILAPFIGATLLILTLTLYPGGIGQQLIPLRRWLAGGPLTESRHEAGQLAGFTGLLAVVVALILAVGPLGWGLGLLVAIVAAAAAAVGAGVGLGRYVRGVHRQRMRARPPTDVGAAAPLPGAVAREGATAATAVRSGSPEEPSPAVTAAPASVSADADEPAGPASGDGGGGPPPSSEEATHPMEATRGTRTARFRRKRGR